MQTERFPSLTQNAESGIQTPPSAFTRIRVLGQFRLEYYDGTAWHMLVHPFLNHQSVRLLLGFLSRCCDRTASWRQVMNVVWPLEDEDGACTRISRFVQELHQTIPDCSPTHHPASPLIHIGDEALSLVGQTEAWVDADAFEQLIQQSQHEPDQQQRLLLLEAALHLYGDDFLSDEDELGVLLPQRVSLRWQAKEALPILARLYRNSGKMAEAARVLEKWLRFGSLDEEVYRDIITISVHLDRAEEAHRVYQAIEMHLGRMYELEPMPQTIALFQSMQTRM